MEEDRVISITDEVMKFQVATHRPYTVSAFEARVQTQRLHSPFLTKILTSQHMNKMIVSIW